MICLLLVGASWSVFGAHPETAKFNIFEGTRSPSGRYAVAYRDPKAGEATPSSDDPTVNELVDLKSNKVILKLRGFHGFPDENHGGMAAKYSPKEDLAAIIRMGKWEPRGLALVATKTGKQLDILTKIKSDADRFVGSKIPRKLVYDVAGARLTAGTVTLAIVGEVPKSVDDSVAYLTASYGYSINAKGITLKKPKIKFIKESDLWHWEDPQP